LRSLQAAKAIQSAVSSQEEDGLRIRVGVHTGDVIPSHDDYLGLTVNKAARVAAAAAGGQVLVSATTADTVNANELEFGAPVLAELTGIESVHTLRSLSGKTAERRPPHSSFDPIWAGEERAWDNGSPRGGRDGEVRHGHVGRGQ
jgi:class 3 adenylate cyclase